LATTSRVNLAISPERAPLQPHSSWSSLIALGIIACVFAVNLYRAAHQSITADEAFTYDWYIDKPLDWIFLVYSTNNHVLHTLLCRLSVQLLGLSELSLRLPSLLGGLLYLAFVYKLCRHLFRTPWTFLLAVAALTLNPFIMDFLSVARGYGMALGLFIAALYFVIRFFDDESLAPNANRISGAAILLGLSISAGLVFVFPAVALAGILTLLGFVDEKPAGGWKQRLGWIMGRVWLPLAVTAALFLAIPVAHEKPGTFRTDVYGTGSLLDTGRSLAQRSLFHQYNLWAGPIPESASRSIEVVARWIIPALLLILSATLIPLCLRWLKARNLRGLSGLDRSYFLIGAVLAVSLGMLVAVRYLFGYLYPLDRTGIYLVALLTLAWILLIETLLIERHQESPQLWRTMGAVAAVPAVIAIVFFLRGLTTSYYYEWRYDAGTKRIFLLLQQQRQQFSGSRQMKLGVDWRLDFSFNFYRRMYQADWLAKVNRDPREAGGFDYYVTYPQDEGALKNLGLRKIYQDPISAQELLVPINFHAAERLLESSRVQLPRP